jgi:PKD repeat protein
MGKTKGQAVMRRLWLIVLLAMSGGGALARGEVLGPGWFYRRTLTFKQALSNAPGENAAWTEFYANGTQRPDGADFRVTTADRIVVPIKRLQTSPDNDLVRIAFATHGDGPYYVWWGNPKMADPGPALDLKRGVYLQEFHDVGVRGVDLRDANGIHSLFDRAAAEDRSTGGTLVQSVFQGWNPLGEHAGAMLHYHAQFKIDSNVNADFAFTVTDAGLLSIDGNSLDHDVRGGLRNRVRNSKPLALSAGWHSIDVFQVNTGAQNTAVAVVWKRGEERGYSPMPPTLFAPAAVALAGTLEKIGASYIADFSIDPQAELFIPPESFVPRYVFEVRMPDSFSPQISWSFGDGQKSLGARKLSHYFLAPGTYPVSLTVKEGAGTFTTIKRIVVQDRLYDLFPKPPQDPPKKGIPWLRDYDVAALSGAQALKGMLLFQDQGDADLMASWGKAWLQSKDAPSDKVLADETFDLTRLLEGRRDYAGMAADFHLASEKQGGMLVRLDLMRAEIMVRCDDLEDAPAALTLARSWRGKINSADKSQVRAVESAVIYAAIAAGDAKTAHDALAAAGKAALGAYADAQLQQGVLARNVENYIRTKDYDTALQLLNQWERDYPEAIWDGFTRTLRVKLLAAENEPLVAARIAVQYAKANPASFYAAELLYRAAGHFKEARDATQAAAAMDLLKSKYPESPYARGEHATD